jgi:peptidyl-prolyl cis-trans isomerase B (cyclophilin B)
VAGSRRIREVERLRLERQAARRAAARARARRRNAAISATLATLLVLGGVVYLGVKLAGSRSPANVAAPGPDCLYTRPPGGEKPARDVGFPPLTKVDKKAAYTATLVTNRGTVTFDFRTAAAPCTTSAIRYLAEKKYYDKTPCHRLTSGGLSVLQCGDPTGTGMGGPGFVYPDENLKGATYPAGTVAMANSGPNTNGSQFFLVYADSQLEPKYIPFGKITSGLDVLMKVAAGGSTPPGDGKPKLPVIIDSLTVAKKTT